VLLTGLLEHIKDLEEKKKNGVATWDEEYFFPQETYSVITLDSESIMVIIISTRNITNKLTGRIGDTPIFKIGFWAEEWENCHDAPATWVQ
jgi:isoaspartyl peptidase/L-asparaginase-like protein (Ntn-hydrolase superfamily)